MHDHQKPVEISHVLEQNELGYVVVTADLITLFSRSTYCPLVCNSTDKEPGSVSTPVLEHRYIHRDREGT